MTNVLAGFIGSLVLTTLFFLLGSTLKKPLRGCDEIRMGIYFLSFGMIFFLVFILVVGSLGFLNRPVILVFVVLVFIVKFPILRLWLGWLRELALWLYGKTKAECFFSALLYVAFGMTFLFCAAPETGNDALCYQLNVPKYFVWQGSIRPVPFDINSCIPMAMNCLYAVGLLFKSVMLAKFFHWLTGGIATLLIVNVLRGYGVSRVISLLTGTAFFLMPTVANEITTTYVDVATALFVLLAIILMVEGSLQKRAFFYFLSGLAYSMAVGIKFSLLILLLPLFATSVYLCKRYDLGTRYFKYAGLFAAGSVLICGYWFVRNYWIFQNPFFPYFGEFFGTIGMTNYSTYLDPGIPKTLSNLILLPFHLTFNPDAFGRGHWIGPIAALAIPALILAALKRRGVPFLVFAMIGTVLWFFTTQASRYLLPVLPAWYILFGLGAQDLAVTLQAKMWLRRIAITVLAGFLVCLLGATLYHFRYHFMLASGQWSPDQYLDNLERTSPVTKWVNSNLPENARIFNVEEIRAFYFKRDMVRERNFNFFTDYARGRSSEEVLGYLKSHGFTHVMLTSLAGAEDLNSSGDGERRSKILEFLADPLKAKFLVEIASENIKEAKYDYKLYELL